MDILETQDVAVEKVEAFFSQADQSIKEHVSENQSGYFLTENEELLGFFSLTTIDEQAVWLRSLFVQPKSRVEMPLLLFEAAEQIAKQQKAEMLWIKVDKEAVKQLVLWLEYKRADSTPAIDTLTEKEKMQDWFQKSL